MVDQFGGLGGLLKGLSAFMPQDDPDVKLMNAQSELSELHKQEMELYAQIGMQTLARGRGQFPELEEKLELIQRNIQEASQKIQRFQAEKEEKDALKQAKEADRTCSSCGYLNPDNVKFCQECGNRLGARRCIKCGVVLAPSIRFCGECGAKQE